MGDERSESEFVAVVPHSAEARRVRLPGQHPAGLGLVAADGVGEVRAGTVPFGSLRAPEILLDGQHHEGVERPQGPR